MMSVSLCVIASLVLIASSATVPKVCPVEDPFPLEGQVSGLAAFSYEPEERNGPARWGDMNCDSGRFSAFAACSYCTPTECLGKSQSPINIVRANWTAKPLDQGPKISIPDNASMVFKPAPANFELECIEKNTCGSSEYQGTTYFVDHIHFHHSSEHQVDGESFPMELHFVHISAEGGLFVVTEIFTPGAHNEALEMVFKIADWQTRGIVDLGFLIGPAANGTAVYKGGLTTPPCSEGVTFAVSMNFENASMEQIEHYMKLVGNMKNNRPVQPLNDRSVTIYS